MILKLFSNIIVTLKEYKPKKMPLLHPPKKNFYIKSLAYFADKLQVEVNDNTVNIPADLGFGFIKGFSWKKVLPSGISILL